MTEVLTIDQVAEELQVAPRTVRRAIAERGLPALQLSRRGTIRVRREDLDAWLEEQATARPVRSAPRMDPIALPAHQHAGRRAARPRRATGVLTVTPEMGHP